MTVLNDARNGRDDEEDMSDERDPYADADGLVAAPARVRDVRAEEGNNVDPARQHQLSTYCDLEDGEQ